MHTVRRRDNSRSTLLSCSLFFLLLPPSAACVHRQLNEYFSSLGTQVLVNDNGLMGSALLTGMATFTLVWPIARQRRLPYAWALVQRILRFLPAMACVPSPSSLSCD